MIFLWNVGIFTHNTPLFFHYKDDKVRTLTKNFPVYMDEKNCLHPKKNLINFVANFSFFELFKSFGTNGQILESRDKICNDFFRIWKKT